jgi:outer membrane protein OmpA-like peptidoglycan-associated protein
VLRSRVTVEEEQATRRPREGAGGRLPFDDRPLIVRPPSRDEVQKIIVDRRRSRDLDQVELNRRIRVYRDIMNDERYSAAEREEYIRYLEDDRAELRSRLVSGRRERADRWREARDNRVVDVDVDIELEEYEGRPREVTIWAAEVDDEAIEEQLVARPLSPVRARYTREQILSEPEVVVSQPEVRRSVPSVEIDTVHFGFNEAFVREEEIANLERIGKIVEKIVAAHPDEVFIIEGHTDAVGDDAYNIELSKKRAEAVKQALTEYYVIAAENLSTAGLGERYLKIPTTEEEGENRRVTLRRMTSLVQK